MLPLLLACGPELHPEPELLDEMLDAGPTDAALVQCLLLQMPVTEEIMKAARDAAWTRGHDVRRPEDLRRQLELARARWTVEGEGDPANRQLCTAGLGRHPDVDAAWFVEHGDTLRLLMLGAVDTRVDLAKLPDEPAAAIAMVRGYLSCDPATRAAGGSGTPPTAPGGTVWTQAQWLVATLLDLRAFFEKGRPGWGGVGRFDYADGALSIDGAGPCFGEARGTRWRWHGPNAWTVDS